MVDTNFERLGVTLQEVTPTNQPQPKGNKSKKRPVSNAANAGQKTN